MGMPMGQGMGPMNPMMQGKGGGDFNDPISQFIAKWGIDAGASQMLRNSSPQLQQVTLNNFNPGQGMNNSGKLVSYLKKLSQGGMQNQGAQGMSNPNASQYS